jgi:hypothetical protein
MSRGLGERQRWILSRLAALDGGGPPQFHALADMYGGSYRDAYSEARAVHRAAHGLGQRGLVRITHRAVDSRAQVFVKITGSGREVVTRAGDSTTKPK